MIKVRAYVIAVFILATNNFNAVHAAGLDATLKSAFGGMTNVTAPSGHIDGISRGYISGGSIQARWPIIKPSVIGFIPPSAQAGCGGIDMYGGAMSFIGKEEFENFLRAIAANATGYAFQLALGAMCPDCRHLMNDLQKKVQKLNEMMADSCQVAQGIINDTLGAMDNKAQTKASMMETFKGTGDAFKNLFKAEVFTKYGKDKTEKKKGAGKDTRSLSSDKLPCSLKGNLAWCGLKNSPTDVASWFTLDPVKGTKGGDTKAEDFLELMMTVSGTLIVKDATAPVDAGGPAYPVESIPGTLGIENLIEGGSLSILNCDVTTGPEDCTTATYVTVTVKGIKEQMLDKLLGVGTTDGVISKYIKGTELTTEDKQIMSSLGMAGALVTQLSAVSEKATRGFVVNVADQMAYGLAYSLIDSMLQGVITASGASDSAYRIEYIKILTDSKRRITGEANKLQTKYGNIKDIFDYYNNLAVNMKLKNYLPQK